MPTSRTKTMWKLRFFAIWREGEEARWLKSMSADGWHLKNVGFLIYEFEKGEPHDYEYALDFRIEVRTDMQEYRGLIEDSGWHYLTHMGGWQYFRIDANKTAGAEIYSDTKSLMGKYWRVLGILGLSALPLLVIFLNYVLSQPTVTHTFPIYVFSILLAIIVYSVFRILLLILRKHEKSE